MLSILVINSKGGSGKTTLTTNLASFYASKNFKTAILDYDPQGSSLQWLSVRPVHLQRQRAEIKDVDVDVARAFIDGSLAAHFRLDLLRSIEELEGEMFCAGFDDHVEEMGLIEDISGGGFDDGATADGFDLFGAEALDSFVEESLAVAEIGAEG